MLCVATSWTRFGRPAGLFEENDMPIDIHGGDIETSVMLALHPEKVDVRKAENFESEQSRFLKENMYLHAYGRHAFGWKMQDLNPIGVTGNAKAATVEKGERLLEHAVGGLIGLLNEVDKFDLELFERKTK
jgi:creatinine amidohydrolase